MTTETRSLYSQLPAIDRLLRDSSFLSLRDTYGHTRVVELLPGQKAVVDLSGVRKQVSIALVDDAQLGDYVIVHVGYAIGKIDPEEAERTLALFAELASAQGDA